MGEYSSDAPLLLKTPEVEKKTVAYLVKSTAKRVIKLLIWVVFIAWVSLMFLYPSEFMSHFVTKIWIGATDGTVFGLAGLLTDRLHFS